MGEPTLKRNNNVVREFLQLKADLEVIEYYEGNDCTQLLQKIADIPSQVNKIYIFYINYTSGKIYILK